MVPGLAERTVHVVAAPAAQVVSPAARVSRVATGRPSGVAARVAQYEDRGRGVDPRTHEDYFSGAFEKCQFMGTSPDPPLRGELRCSLSPTAAATTTAATTAVQQSSKVRLATIPTQAPSVTSRPAQQTTRVVVHASAHQSVHPIDKRQYAMMVQKPGADVTPTVACPTAATPSAASPTAASPSGASTEVTSRDAASTMIKTDSQASGVSEARSDVSDASRVAERGCRFGRQSSSSDSDVKRPPWLFWKGSEWDELADDHVPTENTCSKCEGRGVRKVGSPGWGLLRRCRHCRGPGSWRASWESLKSPMDSLGEEGGEEKVPEASKDDEPNPDMLDKLDFLADKRVIGVAAVGAGVCVALHPALAMYVPKAVSAALGISSKIADISEPEQFLVDIVPYIEVTTSNLERVRGLPAAQVDDRLERPVCEIAALLEKLSKLVTRFLARKRLAKVLALSDFNQKRDELLGSLERWNGVLMHAMQSVAQDTLQTVVDEVRVLREELKEERARSKSVGATCHAHVRAGEQRQMPRVMLRVA